jgi:hypothetical protein
MEKIIDFLLYFFFFFIGFILGYLWALFDIIRSFKK